MLQPLVSLEKLRRVIPASEFRAGQILNSFDSLTLSENPKGETLGNHQHPIGLAENQVYRVCLNCLR